MSEQTVQVVLIVLAIGLVLNLLLTVRLCQFFQYRKTEKSLIPEVGAPIENIVGQDLTGASRSLLVTGVPSVLLFLSSQCPKCRAKLPEISALLAPAKRQGVVVSLVSLESDRILKNFFGASGLSHAALKVSRKQYVQLNPMRYSPLYLFVNHLGLLEAGGELGDENWQAFIAQVTEDLELSNTAQIVAP